jgi:hypothetical protein
LATGSTKFKNSINIEPQSSDPSSPAEGDIFVSDGTSRAAGAWQYISGAWAEFGGGGSGGINYMTDDNTNAENGVGDWTAYADAAGENAVDGTGGAPTITITQNTTTPLRETGDFKFTKDAVNRQGEGAGCAFTIDNADKGKKLTISFDYDASDTDYADDDIRISVYDVTNSNLIRINGEDLKASSLPKTHYAQFQAASDSTSYRLIIHQSSTNAAAYDIYFDNIKVGPTNIAIGFPDPEQYSEANGDFTVTGTNWTTTTAIAVPYKTGDGTWRLKFNIEGSVSVGTTLLDLTMSGITNTVNQSISGGQRSSAGGRINFAQARSDGTFRTATDVSSTLFLCSGDIQIDSKPTWARDLTHTGMSSDLGGRVVDCLVYLASAQNVTSIASTTVQLDTVLSDTTNSFNTGTYTYTVPETGFYDMKAAIGSYAVLGDDQYRIKLMVNGSEVCRSENKTVADTVYTNTSIVKELTKGDTVTVEVDAGTDANYYLYGNSEITYLSIHKLASPQTQLETETVAASYTDSSGLSLTAATWTNLPYDTKTVDTHAAYSSGTYTVPVSGVYEIYATWRINATTTGTDYTRILVNNSEVARAAVETSSTFATIPVKYLGDLSKGDTIDIEVYTTSSSRSVASATPQYNQFSVKRIK